jgi:segregation and condensation protein A
MTYRVKLHNFEGPLDLLLFLIRKNEVDIYDIPIALITRQYLEYIHLMQKFDLDLASEFILMAATLIRIKAQMLLPKPNIEAEMEEFDPRQELIERLVEYKKYKEIAFELSRRESYQRLHFVRRVPDIQFAEFHGDEPIYGQVSLFDLLAAFNESLKRIENEPIHQVVAPIVNMEDQINFILSLLKDQAQMSFTELMQHVHIQTRSVFVTTFLAMLELIRSRKLIIKQKEPFSEIWIFNPQINN